MNIKQVVGLSLLSVAIAASLGGCGEKGEKGEAATSKPTQVAAKVNKDEITVHQLNLELSRMANANPDQAKQAAGQVLKSLVDQQLLVQKAIEDKLDRDPEVVQTLESVRRQVLAQAYLKHAIANMPEPGDTEISDYYNKHPELFAERRIYQLQEMIIQVTPENTEQVKTRLAKSKNLAELGEWLKAQKIPARIGQSVKTAEQLPLELLPRLHQMKAGQALSLASGSQLNVLHVVGTQSQPVDLEKARPMIQTYLDNAKKREAAEAAVKKLREAAKIEYMGEYVELGKEPAAEAKPAAVEAPAQPPAPEAAAPAAPAPEAPADVAPIDKGAIEKGMQGLK